MDRSDIARSQIGTFSIRRRVVLEQLNPVSGRLENGNRDFRAGHSGDFTGEVAGMMCPMRKLEAENILPEGKRLIDVRDGKSGVVDCDDPEWRRVHVIRAEGSDG